MRVAFTRSARRQIETIVEGIAEHSPQGAVRIRARISAVVSLLADHPKLGRMTEMEGVRRVPVVPFPYLIFYRVTPAAVFVRHAARDPFGPLDD